VPRKLTNSQKEYAERQLDHEKRIRRLEKQVKVGEEKLSKIFEEGKKLQKTLKDVQRRNR
jgi:hypothetical protein